MNKKILAAITAIVLSVGSVVPVTAKKKESIVLNEWNEITLLGTVERTSTKSRNTTVEIYQSGANKFAYVGFANGNGSSSEALVVYNVTDPANITEVARYTGIVTRIMNSQFVIVDDYLIVSSKQGSNNKLLKYSIQADGTLSSSATEICTGGNGIDTVYVCGDYLFYALAGTSGKHMKIFDISDIDSGIVLKGTTADNSGIYKAAIEKISDELYKLCYVSRSDADGYRFCVSNMSISNGNVSISEVYHGTDKFETATALSGITGLNCVGTNKVVMTLSVNTNGKYSQLMLDTSGDSLTVSPIAAGRAHTAVDVTDDIFAVGTQEGNIIFYDKADNSSEHSIASGLGQVYDLNVHDGKLYVSGESKFGIYDLYSTVSMNMADIAEINDGILCVTADIEAKDTDKIILDVLDEEIDVTSEVTNGKLNFTKKIDCKDGSYKAKLSIKRDTDILLSDTKTFKVKKTMPIKITNSSLTTGTATVTGTVRNTHSTATAAGKVYLAVYNSDGSMENAYTDEISSLAKDASENIEFTLDEAVKAGQIVKIFAVDNSGKVISDVTETASQSFNIVTNKIPMPIADSVNIYAEVDTDLLIAQISGKSADEKENDIFIAVYKPQPNDTQLDYVNVFKSMSNGGFYCAYPLKTGAEGEDYTVKVYATADKVLSGEKQFSYYSKTTIDAALEAVKNATASTFESVAISASSPYKKVLGLNTSVYDTLIDNESNKYKLAVGAAVAGKTYTDIAALNTAFETAVNAQKALMDTENEEISAIRDINASSAEELKGKVENNATILELNTMGLYTQISKTMSDNLYNNWIYNRGFKDKAAIQTAFANGLAVEYLRLAQYGSIVEKRIIETYYSELGLDYTDVQEYSAMTEQERKDAVAYFLELDLSNYGNLASKFNEALDDYDKKGGTPGSTITTGGNAGSTVKPAADKAPEIKEEDLIPSEILEIEKKNVFNDVKVDDWFFEAVCTLNNRKIVEGITENEYKPNQNVKREEFTKMIVGAFGLVDYSAESTFNDVASNRWYYAYIATAQKLGLISGVGDGRFGVGRDMTRQELAKLVYDTMKALGKPIESTKTADFVDMDSVSDYAKEAVNAMYSAGIMNGFTDNTFGPHGTVTRAMAAQVIYRIIR